MKAYKNLENVFRELAHLQHVSAISHWDEAVMMPAGGGQARAAALASLQALRHRLLVDAKVKHWLDESKQATELSLWQQANLYWMEQQYLNASCLPTDLVERSELTFIRCEQAWRRLRAQNNWQEFLPLLTENITLIKEAAKIKAEVFGMDAYDCLINETSPGVTQAILDPIFAQLKEFLPNFIQQVMTKQKTPQAIIGSFPVKKQRKLGLHLMRILGFDFNHGRLDVSHHPFCGGVPQDVRITTRYTKNEFISSSLAVCHETGHALYELGLPQDWLDQPVGEPLGMTMHESQSLLIEMQACRSREFMQFLSLLVNEYFGEDALYSPENLYRHYVYVKPGLIRVDADEACYPLHIIMRYELEKKLMNNEITCKDLPDLWHEYMQNFFGLSTLGDYCNGIMQDVHWPSGSLGYFPGYTIGAIVAAQLFQAVKQQYPDITAQLATGDFKTLVSWLRKNVHSRGRLLSMQNLLVEATGQPLNVEFYINHLQDRYYNND